MNNKKQFYKINTSDILITILILVFSIYLLFLSNKNVFSQEKIAMIYENNKLLYNINLSEEKDKKFVKLKYITVEIKNKKVRIIQSSCPYKICQHTGWISKPGQKIVCVPQKVLIEIVGTQKQKEYDTLSY